MLHTFDESVGYPTVLTGRKIVHLLHLRLRFYDITPEQWTVLRILGEQDSITQKELAQRSGKDQATLTRILDILHRKEWIERQANINDRRSFLIDLTDQGRTLLKKLTPILEETFTKICAGISEEKIELFKQVLIQMNENLQEEFEKQKV